jgi:hypothetical protein
LKGDKGKGLEGGKKWNEEKELNSWVSGRNRRGKEE